jgi:uncharacterized Ntn-hydrolase superfamily protein
VDDALRTLLNADDDAEQRQLHGVDTDGTFAFSGEECNGWYGHVEGENYTVAGNLLVGESVVDETASAYENGDRDAPLAERFIDALAAGQAEGGDKREELHVQSAALLVETTEDREMEPYYDDLRVDASETPIEDLRAIYERAREGFRDGRRTIRGCVEEDDIEDGGDDVRGGDDKT